MTSQRGNQGNQGHHADRGSSDTGWSVVRALHLRMESAGENTGIWKVTTVVARVALAAAFLSAVADRWGLWGEPGTNSVAWGTFDAYVDRTGDLAPYASGGLLQTIAVLGTVAELTLGLALLLGVALRWTSWLSVGLLLVFGSSMAVFVDPQAPLVYSVFSALAASMMLALAPSGSLVLTADGLVARRLSHRSGAGAADVPSPRRVEEHSVA